MTPTKLLKLISVCTLVSDVGIQNGNQVYFHLTNVNPDDMDECCDKGGEFTEFLISLGITDEMIVWNDCEGCYDEGMVSLDDKFAE